METKEKKQVLSAITKATNILVTVGVDPSVDELAALLGLSLLLGKLDKHATAVFSGAIPPAISFLEPGKTFESTVDGLRDFIIALNKDKADHLRYKLDGDVVKIFITPYKNTIIRDTDLQFSQGDFNVDLVLALGVSNKADLDSAVASHGRILHDATTISLSAGTDTSDLGEIDWHAERASSLCEMLVSLARDLGDDLIDEHVATALLTGIVARTQRFSNNPTTSDVMKTAANLMALGANQQLIATRLEEAEEPTPAPQPVRRDEPAPKQDTDEPVSPDGSMQIEHNERENNDDEPDTSEAPILNGPSLTDIERNKDRVLQAELDRVIPAARVDLDDLTNDDGEGQGTSRRFVARANGFDAQSPSMGEPSMGGTLNATTEQAEEDSRNALEEDRNRVILSHDAPPAQAADAPLTAPAREERMVEPISAQPKAAPLIMPTPPPATTPSVEDALATLGYPAGSHPTLADLDEKTGRSAEPATETPLVQTAKPPLEVDDARAAVANALDSVFTPANNPAASVGSQPLGSDLHLPEPLSQPSTAIELPPLPPLPPLPGQENGLPPLPPLPDLGELDAHSDEPRPSTPAASGPTETDWTAHTVEPPSANDPGQFHIPGQK